MSVFKTTFSRALKVIPSDDCNVPSPNLLISSVSTSQGTNLLIDTTAKFYVNVTSEADNSQRREYKVNVGDVVYNYSTGKAATIVEVVSDTTLLLNADNIVLTSEPYFIYQEGPQTGLGNQGCYLYISNISVIGDLNINTIGGDEISFTNIPTGLLPIQVKKVFELGTNLTDITALW